jgi:hypothetical protein
MITQLSPYVRNGIALLDVKMPGWWDEAHIDLDTLDVMDSCSCVLGQLFEDQVPTGYDFGYDFGQEALGLETIGYRRAPGPGDVDYYGFDVPTHVTDSYGNWLSLERGYAILTRMWAAAIRSRRAASAVS